MSVENKNSQRTAAAKAPSGNCWEATLNHYRYEQNLTKATEFISVTECNHISSVLSLPAYSAKILKFH